MWRDRFSLTASQWRYAAIISGPCESVGALTGMLYWYSYSVTHWAKTAIYSANSGEGIPPGTEGFAALSLMFIHPLTWLLCFCVIEGTVRFLGAAFACEVLGIFPLFIANKFWNRYVFRTVIIIDELNYSADSAGEVLEIKSSRPKDGWEPPRIIRCGELYYRLENISRLSGSRPIRYFLRRLSAGVPGFTVITYSPPEQRANENLTVQKSG
jgi:hypothetical protein